MLDRKERKNVEITSLRAQYQVFRGCAQKITLEMERAAHFTPRNEILDLKAPGK